jgi:hypothetical protein
MGLPSGAYVPIQHFFSSMRSFLADQEDLCRGTVSWAKLLGDFHSYEDMFALDWVFSGSAEEQSYAETLNPVRLSIFICVVG